MKKIEIFNSSILILENIDVTPYDKTSEFYKQLDRELNHSKSVPIEAYGGLYQTFENELYNVKDFDNFFNLLYPSVEKARKSFDIEKSVLSFRRLWVNRIFTNCQSFTHNHFSVDHDPCDLVGIFYFISEGHSADLVFTNLTEVGKFADQILPANKEIIEVKTGTFVFHKPEIYHAVSKHNSDIPRICFVFEFNFLDENEIKNNDILI